MHQSINTLGDLQVVRHNYLQYSREAKKDPKGHTDWTCRETKIARAERYARMYLTIFRRALCGPIGNLP